MAKSTASHPRTAKSTPKVPRAGLGPTRLPAAKAKSTAVRVRMFRQGLGDCFLLSFDPEGEVRHVLIDCGTLGAKTTGVGLKQVAQEIAATVGPRGLDLLIATHEHWDHVAGFNPAAGLFANMPVKQVWLAWTENPSDDDAKKLATNKTDLGKAFGAAFRALGAAAADERCAAVQKAVTDLVEFGAGPLGATAISPSVNAAMNAVRTGFSGAVVSYREPGDATLEHDWLKGFRVYVLGPPRNFEALKRLGEHGSKEIYGLAAGVRTAAARIASGGTLADDESPFAPRCRHGLDGAPAEQWYKHYHEEGDEWRRIDGDWLHSTADAAEELALQLDSLTNNTSLALAFERIADGKVLLFPADAQEGNWLSWHEPGVRWNVHQPDGSKKVVTAADLLNRTVFYKVGHHSSHNATASVKGLELMKGANLTAFIPVDRQVALTRHPQGSWRMPARPLYRRLLEKCEGRVMRSDLGWAAPAKGLKAGEPEKEFEGLATDAEWQQWRAAQAAAGYITTSDTHIDFILP